MTSVFRWNQSQPTFWWTHLVRYTLLCSAVFKERLEALHVLLWFSPAELYGHELWAEMMDTVTKAMKSDDTFLQVGVEITWRNNKCFQLRPTCINLLLLWVERHGVLLKKFQVPLWRLECSWPLRRDQECGANCILLDRAVPNLNLSIPVDVIIAPFRMAACNSLGISSHQPTAQTCAAYWRHYVSQPLRRAVS